MRSSPARAFLAVGLCLAAIGCSREPAAPDPAIVFGTEYNKEGLDPVHLQYLWDLSQATAYDTYSLEVNLATGGTLLTPPLYPTWPARCRVVIPPNAIDGIYDPDRDGRVSISIKVPNIPDDDPPGWVPVYQLEPEYLLLTTPATVTLVYPKELDLGDRLQAFCLVWQDSCIGFSDYHLSGVNPTKQTITFQTSHFSRWPVEEGKPGD